MSTNVRTAGSGEIKWGDDSQKSPDRHMKGEYLLVDPPIFGDERQRDGTLCLYYCSASFLVLAAQIYERKDWFTPEGFEMRMGEFVERAKELRSEVLRKREVEDGVTTEDTMKYSEAHKFVHNESLNNVLGVNVIQEDLMPDGYLRINFPDAITDSAGKKYNIRGLNSSEIVRKMVIEGFISMIAYGGHARLVIGKSNKGLILWDPISGKYEIGLRQDVEIIAIAEVEKSPSKKNKPRKRIVW